MGLKGLLVTYSIVFSRVFAQNSGGLTLFSLAIAIFAMLIACFGIIAELRQIALTKGIQNYIKQEWEARKQTNLIEELDAYLCEQENPEDANSPSRLEAIGEIIGRTIFQAGKYSALQSKSVDSRIQNKYDDMVRTGIESKMPPKLKLLQRVLEEVGVDIDVMELMDAGELPYLERSAKKFGLGSLLKNDGQGSSGGVM